jgi:hypothetical protein
MIRESVSVGPPAANGNTIVMERDGYVSQVAGPSAFRLQPMAIITDRNGRLLTIVGPPIASATGISKKANCLHC